MRFIKSRGIHAKPSRKKRQPKIVFDEEPSSEAEDICFEDIYCTVMDLYDEAYENVPESFNRIAQTKNQELNRYKIETEIYYESIQHLGDKIRIRNEMVLDTLMKIEMLLSHGTSDDYERYVKMGLRVNPGNAMFLQRRGYGMRRKQDMIPFGEMDYSYIKYYRAAYENEKRNMIDKQNYLLATLEAESSRDFFTGSLRQINNLIQFDQKPNYELKEARLEVYKISVSFDCKGEIQLHT